MTNVFPTSSGENEGSLAWTLTYGTATLSVSSDYAHGGTKSLKIVSGNNSSFTVRSAIFAITGGSPLDLTSYLRANVTNRWVDVVAQYYQDASGTIYDSYEVLTSGNTSSGVWQTFASSFTPPVTATHAYIEFSISPSAASELFYIDDVTAETTGTNATASVSVISPAAVSLPGPTLLTGANTTVLPSLVNAAVAISGAAFVGASSATVAPAAISAVASVPTISAVGSSYTPTPAVISRVVTIPAPSIATSTATVVASIIHCDTTIQGYSARISSSVLPTHVTGGSSFTVPAPSVNNTTIPVITPIAVTTGINATETAAPYIPTPTIVTTNTTAQNSVSAGVNIVASIYAPTIQTLTQLTGMRVQDLVAITKRHLGGIARSQLNVLQTSLGAGDTTVQFQYPLQGIVEGSTLAIGDELLYVVSARPQSLQATVIRAMEGTLGESHAAGALVEVGPRYPQTEIRRALLDEIRSWPARIARIGTLDYSATSSTTAIPLDGVPEDFYQLLEVRRGPYAGESDSRWKRIKHRVERGAGGDSDAELFITEQLGGNTTIRVTYAAPFDTHDFADEVLLVEDIGLRESLFDIPPLGAAWRLLAPKDIRRVDIDAQGQPRRAEEVPVGSISATANRLKALRDSRLSEEVMRQYKRWPIRIGV